MRRCLKVLWLEVTGKYGTGVEKRKNQTTLFVQLVSTHPNEGQISRRGRGRSPSGRSQPAGARTPSPARSPAARLRHWPAGARRWPPRGSVPIPSPSLPGRGRRVREHTEVKRQQGRLATYLGWKVSGRETNRKSRWKTGRGGTKGRKNTETARVESMRQNCGQPELENFIMWKSPQNKVILSEPGKPFWTPPYCGFLFNKLELVHFRNILPQ